MCVGVLKWQIDKGRKKEKINYSAFFVVTLHCVPIIFMSKLLFMMNKFSILHIKIIHVE